MFAVFDIGGTKTRIALSEDGENFEEPLIIETPKDFSVGVLLIKSRIQTACGGRELKGVAGGIAGPLDREKRMLVKSPHLGTWVGKPLKSELENACGVPVFLENDSALVGLGEAVRGAGQGFRIVAYITVSTGVGGARIINGRIDESVQGFEPGHQIVDLDATLCPQCSDKDLESLISGSSLEKRLGKKPGELHDEQLWHDEAAILAVGLHNVSVFWSPDIIVLGGSMVIKRPGIDVNEVEKHLREIMKIFPEAPRVKEALLKDVGGLYGGLALLQERLRSGDA